MEKKLADLWYCRKRHLMVVLMVVMVLGSFLLQNGERYEVSGFVD